MMQLVHKDTIYMINVLLMCVLCALAFTCWNVLETQKDLKVIDAKIEELKDRPVAEIIIEDPSTIYLDLQVYHKEAQEQTVFNERDNLNVWVEQVATSYDISPEIIKAVIQVESEWNPNAVSSDGTHVGLMQISTKWQKKRANELGVKNMMDPYGNILIGTSYLADTFEETGDIAWALMIYNEGYVSAYQKHTSGIVSSYAMEVMKGASYA